MLWSPLFVTIFLSLSWNKRSWYVSSPFWKMTHHDWLLLPPIRPPLLYDLWDKRRSNNFFSWGYLISFQLLPFSVLFIHFYVCTHFLFSDFFLSWLPPLFTSSPPTFHPHQTCYVAFITNALSLFFIFWSSAVFYLSSRMRSMKISCLLFCPHIFFSASMNRSHQRYRHGPHTNLPAPQSRRSPS